METKLIPNTTQIPNVLMDFVLPRLPEGESKCLSYICRRTYGFHKTQDRISFSQFVDGIKTRDGKRLDYGSGVSRPVVAESLRNLINAGAVLVRKDSRGNVYGIDLNMDPDEVVKKVNQLRKSNKVRIKAKPRQKKFFNFKKKPITPEIEKTCETLKKWNETQSSPMVNFVPENIVNKHGKEKVEQLIKYYGQMNGGFSRFMTALNA